MTKAKAGSQKDLFGHIIKRRPSRLESLLTRIDRESYQIRLERLKYIESITPKGLGMVGSIEAIFIFQEAGLGLSQWSVHFNDFALPSLC